MMMDAWLALSEVIGMPERNMTKNVLTQIEVGLWHDRRDDSGCTSIEKM